MSYCQCRSGGERLSCGACIIGSGGEERKEEEEGGGENGEAHLVRLKWEVRRFFLLLLFTSVARFCAGQKKLRGSGLLRIAGGDALQQPFYIFTNKGNIQWQMNERRVTDPMQTGAGRGFRGLSLSARGRV